MNIFDEFTDIVKHIDKEGIKYALVGGVAMAFYQEPRYTQDIDMLLGPNDLELARKILEQNRYIETAEPWTFSTTPLTLHRFIKVEGEEAMIIDLLVAGNDSQLKIIENALDMEGDGGNVSVAKKSDIIWLKRQRKSPQDLVDIKGLEDAES